MKRHYLVTGGSGFIGSALVRRLVSEGHQVRVLDDDSRGSATRLEALRDQIELMSGDVRSLDDVRRAVQGVDSILHLAFVNGTEFFYSKPDLVLEVGVKGMVNILDAAKNAGVEELVLASSSEVYQTPPQVPTDETAPLIVPDPHNPRYSYGSGKLISEMMALHMATKFMKRVMIFRPHNVYGPDMGFEHVLPQFVLRMKKLALAYPEGNIPFPIQGTGEETRSFIEIEDFVDGVLLMLERGEHGNIYHIGTMDEVSIKRVAEHVASTFGRKIDIQMDQNTPAGGTLRRCPDIRKMRGLGFDPRTPLEKGIKRLADWYVSHERQTT